MQSIEAASGEKARNRIGAAFDQNAPEALRSQCREDGWRCDMAAAGEADNLDSLRMPNARTFAGQDQAADTIGGERFGRCRQSSVRVDYYPRRARASDVAHG